MLEDKNQNLNSNRKDVEDEDFSLIRAFNEGNESAFTKLMLKHKDKVQNLIYLTLGENEFVDDIIQDVFISIYKKLSDFRFESKFSTWIYRITVNKCRDYLRKKRVRSIFVPIKDTDREPAAVIRSESIDIPAIVRKAIARLPEKLREPLILRDIDGFSYQEIADQLECEVGTIKSRIFRARESLKILLEPYQNEIKK